MRTLIALLVLFSGNAQGVEMVNPDLENLKSRLLGVWTFIEDNKPYEATFEAVSHGNALLERNSGFIAVYHADENSMLVHGPSNICTHASSIPIDTFAFVLTGGKSRGCVNGAGVGVALGVGVAAGASVSARFPERR
jgi:hypothetical protein